MFALDIGPRFLVSGAGKEGEAHVTIRVLVDIFPFPHSPNTGNRPLAQGKDDGHGIGVSDGCSLRAAPLAGLLGGFMLVGGKVIPVNDVRRDAGSTQNLADASPVLGRGDGKV